jgi:putative Ca2+/H+ antiporter (TMEM165/GDT1 family)
MRRDNYESIMKVAPVPTDPVSTPPSPIVESSTLAKSDPSIPLNSQPKHRFPWREFLTAFGTIFLAELGDKTQLATLLMAAESQSPWVVFIGAATALVATSLVGVLVGRWLADKLSPETLKTSTGITLLVISVLLLWDVVHL